MPKVYSRLPFHFISNEIYDILIHIHTTPTVSNVHGTFLHFTLFSRFDDNDDDDCLLCTFSCLSSFCFCYFLTVSAQILKLPTATRGEVYEHKKIYGKLLVKEVKKNDDDDEDKKKEKRGFWVEVVRVKETHNGYY